MPASPASTHEPAGIDRLVVILIERHRQRWQGQRGLGTAAGVEIAIGTPHRDVAAKHRQRAARVHQNAAIGEGVDGAPTQRQDAEIAQLQIWVGLGGRRSNHTAAVRSEWSCKHRAREAMNDRDKRFVFDRDKRFVFAPLERD
jgi:hypothetical protein